LDETLFLFLSEYGTVQYDKVRYGTELNSPEKDTFVAGNQGI